MDNQIAKIFLFVYLPLSLFGQEQKKVEVNRYFVYFTSKVSEGYPFSLDESEKFLTDRSIQRRKKQSIALDSSDLPVNPQFVAAIRERGIDVYFTSKWLNGALLQMPVENESVVKSFDFVDSLRLIAKGTRLVAREAPRSPPDAFEEPTPTQGSTDLQLMMIGALSMHKERIYGQGMRIGIIDDGYSGVDKYTPFAHLWENDRIVGSRDFVKNSDNVFQGGSHGTSVLSVMGAHYESDVSIFRGVVHEAEFVLCVGEDGASENVVEEYNYVMAAEYADSLGVDVINSSLGYRFFDIAAHNYSLDDLDGNTSVSSIGANFAAQKGIIVVSSAGNSGGKKPPDNRINHPADAENILTVGSVDMNYQKSNFSSVGPTKDGKIKPDVCALGVKNTVIVGDGTIGSLSGTSFSAPLIAGLAAGVWQRHPEWSSEEVMGVIKKSGSNANNPDILIGYGVPNYSLITDNQNKGINLKYVLSEDEVIFYPNPFTGNSLFFRVSEPQKSPIVIEIYDPRGVRVFEKKYLPKHLKNEVEIRIEESMMGTYYLFVQSEKMKKVCKLIKF